MTISPKPESSFFSFLQTLTETHQTVAAISVLVTVTRPLLTRSIFPAGGQHLVPLLNLTLPGIDPNDGIKTCATLQFYMSVLCSIPLQDVSHCSPADASEADLQLYASTALLEDWTAQLLDRIFVLMETQVEAAASGQSMERSIGSLLRVMMHDLFQQASPAIYDMALQKLYMWVTSHLVLSSSKIAGHFAAAAVRANPAKGLKKFMPFLTQRILDLCGSHHTVSQSSGDASDDELVWYMHILSRLVKAAGPALLEYKAQIVSLLDATLTVAVKTASKLAGKFLRHTLRSLLDLYITDAKDASPSARAAAGAGAGGEGGESDSNAYKLFEQRGHSEGPLGDIGVTWHVPSQAEFEFAEELAQRFYAPAVAYLKGLIQSGGWGVCVCVCVFCFV